MSVVDVGAFILGPEVARLEEQLAAHADVAHAVTCGNGTDALQLALMGLGIGPGDAVFVPTFTFVAPAEAVVLVGAEPIFVDVRADTFNLDPEDLLTAAAEYRGSGRPCAVIAVDLFGLPADYARLRSITADCGWSLIADAAQSFGASLGGTAVGGLADVTTTSFFPSKPLGCYGDGGALLTESSSLDGLFRSLRAHGKGSQKYDNVRIGMNSRLDTLQAAILLEKLAILENEIVARQNIADRYGACLPTDVVVPEVTAAAQSAWAQYTIRTNRRDDVAASMRADGVESAVYYPLPLHRSRAYAAFPGSNRAFPVAERLAGEVLSLPSHSYLTDDEQAMVVRSVASAIGT